MRLVKLRYMGCKGECMALDRNHHIFTLGMYARDGKLEEMKRTMQVFGIDSGIFNEKGEYEQAIMHCAAEGGHIEVMSWLRARGADVRIKSKKGDEPIHYAVKNGNFEAIKWLKGQGADINAKDSIGFTPAHIAAGGYRGYNQHYTDRLAMLKWLKEQGADFNVKAINTTPIHCAIQSDQLEIVKWLKDNGADIRVTDSDGGTLMHTAAEYGKTRIMEWLKQEGFDINAKNNKGKTPLDMAATPLQFGNASDKKAKEEAVEWLKEQMKSSVAKVEVVNQKNIETTVQPTGYESYLKYLGHEKRTAEMLLVPFENVKQELKAETLSRNADISKSRIELDNLKQESIRLPEQKRLEEEQEYIRLSEKLNNLKQEYIRLPEQKKLTEEEQKKLQKDLDNHKQEYIKKLEQKKLAEEEQRKLAEEIQRKIKQRKFGVVVLRIIIVVVLVVIIYNCL